MPPAGTAAASAPAPAKKTPGVPEKKYKCQFCSRAFSRSEHRSRHERSRRSRFRALPLLEYVLLAHKPFPTPVRGVEGPARPSFCRGALAWPWPSTSTSMTAIVKPQSCLVSGRELSSFGQVTAVLASRADAHRPSHLRAFHVWPCRQHRPYAIARTTAFVSLHHADPSFPQTPKSDRSSA